MTYEYPWEWAEGDPIRSAQFGLLSGVFLGVAASLIVLFSLLLSSEFGLTAFPPIQSWVLLTIVAALFGTEFPVLYLFPRLFPVVGQLGISPFGVRLGLPLVSSTFAWQEIRGLGPDWMEVSRGLGSTRYRLTGYQAYRISRFLRPQ